MGHALTKYRKKEVLKFKPKEEHFIKNGGILLEKQIALGQGQDTGAGQLRILSSKDIQKATNCYDSDVISGRNTSVAVYKGRLEDSIVAIQTPQEIQQNSGLIDLVLTEVSTGMVMNHDNMVRLYGCCLETYIPIPVYEFVPRGNLFPYLHGEFGRRVSLKWADRLRVLTDVSYALSYMHTALSKPVVHRSIGSFYILLDDSFHAKLSNLGYSVSITPGDTSQRWPVIGTPGYIDPEYIETQIVTEKCDVYSFGVLMLELLTGRQPFLMFRTGIDLVDAFVSPVQRNFLTEMMDDEILEQGNWDKIEQVAQLALKCVERKGEVRPTMVEVVCKLWQVQDQHSKSTRRSSLPNSALA